MMYYCKRHKTNAVYTFEGPNEEAFWEHHRKVHGGTRKTERLMGILPEVRV